MIGYRQTIGAKKERIKTANEKVIEIILRRLILERYTPKKEDLKRIIDGKSRDYKIKPRDLLSEEQILTTIYTRIFESDLITQAQREENIERLVNLFEEKEVKTYDVERALITNDKRTKKYVNSFVVGLGIVSTFIGVFFASFDEIVNFDTNYSKLDGIITISIMGSIITIIVIYIFIKIKDSSESSEETPRINPNFKNQIEFEKEVIKLFDKLGVEVIMPTGKDVGFDLIATIDGKRVAVEIKYWKERPPLAYVNRTIQQLEQSMKKENITDGYIVTMKTYNLNSRLTNHDNIRLIELIDLKKIIK